MSGSKNNRHILYFITHKLKKKKTNKHLFCITHIK